MSGLIIEGVTGSGKTRILHALRKLLAAESGFQSQLWLSELVTDRILEDDRKADKICGSEIQSHLDTLIQPIEGLHQLLAQSKFGGASGASELLVVLERLILSHLSHPEQPRCDHFYGPKQIRAHFSKLNALGFKQVVLVIPPEHLRDRVLSTLQYRGDCWRDFLFSKGNEESIVDYFAQWQDRLLANATQYEDQIPTLRITVDHDDLDVYAKKIRGCLYA
jgi:hypothetical protein